MVDPTWLATAPALAFGAAALVLLGLVIALGVQPDLVNRMIQDAVLPILDIGGGA